MKRLMVLTLTLMLMFTLFLKNTPAQEYVHTATLTGHTNSVHSVAFVDNDTLISGGNDATVRAWNISTGGQRWSKTASASVNAVSAPLHEPSFAAYGQSVNTDIRLLSVDTGSQFDTVLSGHLGSVLSLAFGPERGTILTLASASSDKTIRIWHMVKLSDSFFVAPGSTLTGHTRDVSSVAWSPDGLTVASASVDGTVRLWSFYTGKQIAELQGHQGAVFSVAWHPNGKILASGGADKNVRVWDVKTQKQLRALSGHTHSVRSVVFHPNPQMAILASGSEDHTIQLWDVNTFGRTATLSGHIRPVRQVAFSPDGAVLASASNDRTVRLWTLGAVATPTTTTPPEVPTVDDSAPEQETGSSTPTTTGLNMTITPSPSGTMLETGDSRDLTIKITHNGVAWPEKSVRLYTSGSVTPKLTGDSHQDGGIKGTTDDNGEVQTTLKLDLKQIGSFKFIAETAGVLPSDPKVKNELSFTVAEGAGAGAGSVKITTPSSSRITIEPNQGTSDGRVSLVFEVKTPAGNPLAGARIFLSATSSSVISTFTDDRPKTDNKGVAKTTLKLNRSRATGSITVKAVVKEGVEDTLSITVKQTPRSLSVQIGRTTITSGKTTTVTATVKSKNGTPMSNRTVSFSESSSYLRFSPKSRSTNSSGKASATLHTGGKTSGAKITVSTSGVSSKSYTIKVVPELITDTKYFSDEGKRIGLFTRNYYQTRTKTVKFPGKVLSSTWRSRSYSATVISDTISGSTVKVKYKILAKSLPLAWIRVWVTAKYEKLASTPGAPSAHPQFQPEIPLLSEVWQELSQVPSETALLSNYPNPFNPETWIPYHLAEPAEVTITIYAADGRLIRTLALGHQLAGNYENKSRAAYWDGRNAVGEQVASGVFFYTFTAGDFSATKKMLILK